MSYVLFINRVGEKKGEVNDNEKINLILIIVIV